MYKKLENKIICICFDLKEYLGNMITANGKCDNEIERIIVMQKMLLKLIKIFIFFFFWLLPLGIATVDPQSPISPARHIPI